MVEWIEVPSQAAGITVLTQSKVCIGYFMMHDPRMHADVVEQVETF